MTAEIKPKSTKEKKRRPAPPEEFVEYAVEITEWFWNIRRYSVPEGIATTILTVSPGTRRSPAS
ncbi:hypothetical protein [Bradyrhizobium erythrophlei]|uniref:hypothetical protein n=1 Tax=Bradyrhizobium erythrophlei TaxID=1437360 RepID=UPI0012AB3A9A|nr:hypothetical protein [Bradyrhizobium erythrophlei]